MLNHGLSRRQWLAGAGALAAGLPSVGDARELTPPARNPIVRQRADAQIFRHHDGFYYMTASVPQYDRLIVRRSRTLAELGDAEEAVIWRRPPQGRMGGYIWAPELHEIDGRWHMYFAAGDAGEKFRIRTYVLRADGPDALDSSWSLLGQLETPWDTFNLDSTVFEHRGTRYLCWAQKEPGLATNSNLYLAPLATPTTPARPPVRLTVPDLPWEVQGFKVAEAPAILARDGRLFLTYSASATDARYCMGLLTADADANIMDAASWAKSPDPVFVSSDITGVYGPGHNSFTVDDGGRDILVFHGRDYKAIMGDPLFDPNRHTRIQRLYYRADGTPDFGIPVGAGEIPDRLSPLDRAGNYLLLDGERLTIGAGPLPASQFRQRLKADGSVLFEPVLAPGKRVVAAPDGTLALADASHAPPGQSRFRIVPPLTGKRGVSFELLGQNNHYLGHQGETVRVGPATSAKARASATFLIS